MSPLDDSRGASAGCLVPGVPNMNERNIFMEALDRETPTERSNYLDTACAGDAALRQRIEALLQSHERAGGFLEKLGPELLAEELGAEPVAPTEGEATPGRDEGEDLHFLLPADRPGVLGRLGHYEVLEVIGRGGMGIVLRAFDEKLHRVVAVKVMAAALATSATARRRFAREAQAQAAVSHDHIVTIHAVEDADRLPYLVMHFVSGLSLQQRIDRDGPLQLSEILRIGLQAASGLAAAHAQGLIHRDIKPANILLENGVERVKITDFGLARAAADASLTQSGQIAGTPSYMSPEQARGEAVDARSDLFSLGSVLYAMCTGRAPFRAGNQIAVLKRVCEDAPTPIREANPALPEWLCEIVEKLQAKNPADRFQSAAEVAQLLGRHLAHVQHPSVAPLPAAEPPVVMSESRSSFPTRTGRRRWAVAAALVLALVSGLSVTEATGVTNLRATVIRIVTPGGVLVVETDDPDVKITIEGDGGLVITGAGPQEVRVRPGSYQVHAVKDGQVVKLDRELVSISRGDKQVVKVRLEAAGVTGATVAQVGSGEFVVLGVSGVPQAKFETLTEAVARAASGDTIEIRGNGPFLTDPVDLGLKALTIRAGSGFTPVIKPSLAAENSDAPELLRTDSRLVLEGLELHHEGLPETSQRIHRGVIGSKSAPLFLTNCKLIVGRRKLAATTYALASTGASSGHARNCLFVSPECGMLIWDVHGTSWSVDNCLIAASSEAVGLYPNESDPAVPKLRLSRNQLVGRHVVLVPGPGGALVKRVRDKSELPGPAVIETEENVIQAWRMFNLNSSNADTPEGLPVEEQRRLLPLMISWRERGNVDGVTDKSFLNLHVPGIGLLNGLTEWNEFWGIKDSGSMQGPVRLRGNLDALLAETPDAITPDDFRLRPDSAGYRAGKDGKDLGADIELVGPGAAYERWKKTPHYQQWLKETRDNKTSSGSEPKHFILLDGETGTETAFATLAEAVQNAYDGDAIEVRGNGPFITESLVINRALTIRAGAGFRPSFRLSPRDKGILFDTDASLVLEGLDFKFAGQADSAASQRFHAAIHAAGRSLHVAKCRFQSRPGANHACIATTSAVCVVRDSLFLNAGHVAVEVGTSCKSFSVENCFFLGNIITRLGFDSPLSEETEIKLTGNTLLALSPSQAPIVYVSNNFSPEKWKPDGFKVIPVRAQGNLIDTFEIIHFDQSQDQHWKELPTAKAESFLARVFSWQDRDNVYSAGRDRVFWSTNAPGGGPPSPTSLAEWKRFWADPDSKCQEGQIRFRGGDLGSRLVKAPEQITLDDFRLRADSAGFHAGKEGKDLGADVDLIGPGEAYEGWKKTPAYQQWLKETGQNRDKAPRPEPKAFALIGGAGVPEVRFDTLSEAVLASSDGDTIEVRGNGPFPSDAVTISHELTIRAGQGVRPVLRFEGRSPAVPGYYLVHNTAHLTLEGIEFRIRSKTDNGLVYAGRSLDVTNCRFYVPGLHHAIWSGAETRRCTLRNCEFVAFVSLWGGQESGGEWVVENCVYTGGGVVVYQSSSAGRPGGAVRISQVSVVSPPLRAAIGFLPDSLPPAERKVDFHISESVLCPSVLLSASRTASLPENGKPFTPESFAGVLPQRMTFAGTRNVYSPFDPQRAEVEYLQSWADNEIWRHEELKSLDAWKSLWGSPETDCIEGRIKFANGDLAAKIARDLDKVTPDDYRLAKDSPGYRAGKDGKDLGADVDLVGPGPAYERWKKTPEYQQWLKDTEGAATAEIPDR